jgi:hypothetical protein
VRGVLEREEEGDGDRVHSRCDQVARGRLDRRLVERHDLVALVVDALVDFFDEGPGYQRDRLLGGLGVEQHVELESGGATGAPHDKDGVPVAGGGEQPRPGAAPLDQQVGAHGGPQAETLGGRDEFGHALPTFVGQRGEGVEHADGEIVLGGGGLGKVQAAVLVHGRAVGESAPSVDSDVVAHALDSFGA